MKALIIYFSQTGNTRKVAECIREGIVAVTGQCELRELMDVDMASLADYDLVGLGSPVFYFQEPFNVRDFMEGLPELRGRQWFIFCTHGAVMGNTFPSMAERLAKKGITVIGYHHTYADGTLPFYPHPTLTTGHPDFLDFEEARGFGEDIAARSQRIAEGDSSLIPAPGPVPEEWVQNARMLTLEFMDQMMPRLRIDMERCTHCHVCEDNCPVKGIDIEADPPRIQAPCVYCWYCAKTCPVLAIEADWDMLVAMAPENYARYRQALDEAVERGEFRWLIDPDSINLEDPLYKQRERELKDAQRQGDS
ncbi:MAG: EFR1 family ferrodoxin [Candidatus Hydrogenedentota bacterium]|nr:MAG: EFR1 family ferrodoxin [Candidatus Hydrogenedentota bacterium]